jgi:predicted nucleotidyltransferase
MLAEIGPLGKILKFFYENPYEEIYLRQLAKKLNLSSFSVKRYLDILVEEKMVNEIRKGKARFFRANLNNLAFRHLKIAFTLNKILKSGLIDFLKTKIPLVSSIVIYGSIARGEDTKKSDVDLLIIGEKVKVDLEKFKKKLGREITLLIYRPAEWKKKASANRGFYQNIIVDGIVVYGTMPVIE